MSVMLIDRISKVVLHNNIVRIDCVMSGPNREEQPAGTILLPGNQAAAILHSLVVSMRELEKRLREQGSAAQQTTPSSTKQ
jgi:hypothetical protein